MPPQSSNQIATQYLAISFSSLFVHSKCLCQTSSISTEEDPETPPPHIFFQGKKLSNRCLEKSSCLKCFCPDELSCSPNIFCCCITCEIRKSFNFHFNPHAEKLQGLREPFIFLVADVLLVLMW